MAHAPAKKVGYVVMIIGWEYNDEYYHRPDCEGGKPLRVFHTQKEAQAYRNELNNQRVCENEKNTRYAMTDSEDNRITNFYEIVEVEME